jgi:sulfite exporter TauE/SafE
MGIRFYGHFVKAAGDGSMDLWLIFVTGLTTGGLTCLAVQGGLLATALTRQVPVEVNARQRPKKAKNKRNPVTAVQLPKNPLPVLAFLAAKLVAYTLLGFLLGVLGSALQITPTAQGIMQLAVGIYMLLTALNMLNVHPIFRYFVIQPPHAVTRLIRNRAKTQEIFTPVLLGLLTVLIPCGTTQAMMALAISTGNGLWGALIMFVFILGTSPTFFILGVLATRIRGKFQPVFAAAVAALILALAVVSIDGGLNLLGSPLAPGRILAAITRGDDTPSETPVAAQMQDNIQVVTIAARGNGYAPRYVRVQSGLPIRLRLVTNQNYSCSNSFVIPSLGVRRMLPNSGETLIDLPPQKAGNIAFSCGMGMYTGMIVVAG